MEKLCIPLVREENVTNVREGGEGKGASSLFVCGFDAAAAALALAPSPSLPFLLEKDLPVREGRLVSSLCIYRSTTIAASPWIICSGDLLINNVW